MATDNCARWVLSVVRRDLGFDDSHVVTMPELCWWLVRNDLADALPESAARKALRLPKPVVPSVTRESDLVPSVPATSIMQDKAKKVLALKVEPESPESFMLRPKRRRWVNEKYTRWVKTQPCACCGKPADDPHHLIGHGQGGMSTKAHDLFVLPLCRKHHDELHADNSAQAAADSQTASANSATAAKKSETNAKNSEAAAKSSETNAKASETNAKSSETNAAKSAADALNYRNQAQLIVGDNIGLGSAPRDCPDISGNPSGYIGFMRIMSNAKGFPSIASGESSLTGFISQVDGTPAYTGVFQGWATRSLYTYRWNPTIGPQWTRHARKDEVIRFQRSSDTRTIILSTDVQADGCYLQVDADGQWGAFNPKAGRWQPLAVAQGGTGANDASTARSKLEVMFEAKTGLDANTNLNDIKGTTAGFYYQPMSANAKPELNYPIQLAGALLVQRTGANGSDGCIQSYFVYNNSSILYRRIYTSTQGWSVWKKIVLTERIEEGESTTYVYSNYSPSAPRLQVSTSGLWGCHNGSSWVPLPIGQGGTNAATVDGARTNLGLGRNNSPQLNSLFLDRYSDSTNTYTSSGILHTRLLATDSTVRLGADMYVETLSNEPGQLTIRFTYDGSTGASKYLNLNSEGNLIVDSAILKSTVEKPLQIRSANPAIRFNETDRPANTPTYTLIANAGDWFIQKRDYDDAGSVSNAIAYNFANDRIDVQNLKASGLITANSGIATLTGHDWNAQHTDNVDKFRSIAGSTN
ncbi:DUF968 domain-containing protein, partial [Escherichia coli]|uniref:DUF968 domain-containing protein n=1 Tax=Escherichia coli TaxID=562 RepID=UPI002FDBA48F